MKIDMIAYCKLNHVTRQRNLVWGLFALTVIVVISYEVYKYNQNRNLGG
jgi:hypothetical protein